MLDVILKRRSCRNFNSKEVELEKIEEIIKAGLNAPSGMNRQTPVIIALKDKKTRDALMNINREIGGWPEGFDPFYGAPVVLLVIAKKDGLSTLDGAASIQNMLLEATNQGLESCWIHRAEPELFREDVKQLLSFTGLNLDEYVGIDHVIIGYSDKPIYREKTINPNRYFIK